MSRSDSWAGDLTRPWPLVATAALLVNDHLLKGADLLPGGVTGKLSDVAGLFVAGVLAVCLARGSARLVAGRCPRRTGPAGTAALVAVALGFAALKLWPAFNGTLARVWGYNSLDRTDLYALPVLLVAWAWLRDRDGRDAGPQPSRFRTAIALAGVLLACVATPAPPPTPPRPVAAWIASAEPLVLPCGDAAVWVAKSGKTGFGLIVRVVASGDNGCPVAIEDPRLALAGDGIAGQVIAIPQPPPQQQQPDPRHHQQQHLPPPAGPAHYHYVIFAFDNNARWNAGQRTASAELTVASDGRRIPWRIDLRHDYVSFPPGYH